MKNFVLKAINSRHGEATWTKVPQVGLTVTKRVTTEKTLTHQLYKEPWPLCVYLIFSKIKVQNISKPVCRLDLFSIETLKQREELRTDGEFIAGPGVPGQVILLSHWLWGLGHCAIIG